MSRVSKSTVETIRGLVDTNQVETASRLLALALQDFDFDDRMDLMRDLLTPPQAADQFTVRIFGACPEHKIPAIKVIRSLTGAGLKDAKDFIESLNRGSRSLADLGLIGPSETMNIAKRELSMFEGVHVETHRGNPSDTQPEGKADAGRPVTPDYGAWLDRR